MNRHALICRDIWENPQITQRELAQALGLSLGTINKLVKECIQNKWITALENGCYQITPKGMNFLEPYRVDGALIMAAGFGSRFVPLTYETPKGLLEVFGERMIERQIRQLHEKGIHDITIVVGYLKEKFEYLIDKYQVDLLYNKEYSSKNTLATIYHAKEVLRGRNMYVLASDHWMRDNMFHAYECSSWNSSVYMEGETSEWCFSFNKKGKITDIEVGGHDSWVMYGPVFLASSWLEAFLPVLEAYYQLPGTEQFYWEHVYMELLNGNAQKRLPQADFWTEEAMLSQKTELYINRQPASQVYEFENLAELRLFDPKYQNNSDNHALELISHVFGTKESEILDIRCLKAGMTNKSFLFQLHGKHYICRIPGPGTELLINRQQEGEVVSSIRHLRISEHVVYFNDKNGYKIAEYYEGARNADAQSEEDMRRCMELIRKLHQSGIQLKHSFDLRERIDFYETLCLQHGGISFEDYAATREHMNRLLDWLDTQNRPKAITHIDAVADNFLFLPNGELRLIDWEYCGMCDPLVDVAMCAVYSYYSEAQIDHLMKLYFGRMPGKNEQQLIYAYVALGGFLWSLWAIYKTSLGDEFGEYTIRMYRYAKQYYKKLFRDS